MNNDRRYIAIPSGMTIQEQLTDRAMNLKEFVNRMEMSEEVVNSIINGELQLTRDVAVRLEEVLGTPAGFWNNLESIYREKIRHMIGK